MMSDFNEQNIILDLPSMTVFDSYIKALKEGFYRGNEAVKTENEIHEIQRNFENYLFSLNEQGSGFYTTPSGESFQKVPYETLWLTHDDTFIGEVSFRHELNEMLKNFGGHVGYGIRPSLSGQGLATIALKLTMERAKNMGISELLLTCTAENSASRRVIEKNGGVFIDVSNKSYGYKEICQRFKVPT
jgi:predicted acetyltransferase